MMNEQKPGQIPGTVHVVLKQKKHRQFRRQGDNLVTSVEITLKEALLGFERTITHLDQHEVKISRQDVTKIGEQMRVSGEGMPKHNVPSDKGDLIVEIKIEMPKKLTNDQKEAIGQIL